LGVAPFTVLVKGAGFSSLGNTPRTTKRRTGTGQREKLIKNRKKRTLEHHKGAAPEAQNRSKAGAPALRNAGELKEDPEIPRRSFPHCG
jgi:hypothetical protein